MVGGRLDLQLFIRALLGLMYINILGLLFYLQGKKETQFLNRANKPAIHLFIRDNDTWQRNQKLHHELFSFFLRLLHYRFIAWFSWKMMVVFLERWSSELISQVSFLLPFKFQHPLLHVSPCYSAYNFQLVSSEIFSQF